ncbi:hypothetical protein GM911_16475 [Klebsiella pneumoniae]|nr:hypothetical protein [Klebsiella pneumoniae]MBM4699923.1 hypothetical protein [Klebsiella pneumoniae]
MAVASLPACGERKADCILQRYHHSPLIFSIQPYKLNGISIPALAPTSSLSLEGANKQVISSQADSLIKISRIWADFFPANTSNQPI